MRLNHLNPSPEYYHWLEPPDYHTKLQDITNEVYNPIAEFEQHNDNRGTGPKDMERPKT